MHISRLSIENYKIFEGEHSISFPHQSSPVVFVGVNGAGKTTLIESIIGCLWEFYHKVQGKKVPTEERFIRSNINVYSDEFASVELDWEDNEKFQISSGFRIRKTLDPEFEFFGLNQITDYIDYLKGDIGFYKGEARVPIIVYYPVERTVINPSLKTRKAKTGNQFAAYVDAFDKSVNFDNFFEWFRGAEDLENEIRLNRDHTYLDKGLDSVRKAILIFLDDFSKIRVRRTELVTLVLEKKGKEYEVNQLSHGEKAIIAMVGDLARRLVIANPGSKEPLKGDGIVLIDELDLHLHPNWQRTILRKLKKTFPKIQFICTTHSSLVINHLGKESIYILEEGKCIPLVDRYQRFNTYGADIEDILKIVQGTESIIPEDIKLQFDELYKNINNGNLEGAKDIIEELKKLTDPNQPELKKAEIQLQYKKLLEN